MINDKLSSSLEDLQSVEDNQPCILIAKFFTQY
jgi:hypothetical protein